MSPDAHLLAHTAVLVAVGHGVDRPGRQPATAGREPVGVTAVAAGQPIGPLVEALADEIRFVVVWPDATDWTVGEVSRLLDALGDAHACVSTRPVTDAVKIVDGDRVVGAVDRTALIHVQPPMVVCREALVGAAAEVTVEHVGALVRCLVQAGRQVRTLPDDPPAAAAARS